MQLEIRLWISQLGHNAIRFLFFFGSLRRSISRFRLRRGINYFVVILLVPRMDFVSSPVIFRWICENGPSRSRDRNSPTSRSPRYIGFVVRYDATVLRILGRFRSFRASFLDFLFIRLRFRADVKNSHAFLHVFRSGSRR